LGKKSESGVNAVFLEKEALRSGGSFGFRRKKVDALSDVSMPLQIRSLELPRRKNGLASV
jgi:hypothetical protein